MREAPCYSWAYCSYLLFPSAARPLGGGSQSCVSLAPVAGYSKTPLWKKLGYRNGLSAFVENSPANYRQLLALPRDVVISWESRFRKNLTFVHLFVTSFSQLSRKLPLYRESIARDGVIWISWPKKSSGVATDVTEDRIRELALPAGLVDIKVCAVDETWSGLKFVYRLKDRPSLNKTR